MTPEQQARAITELIEARQMAADLIAAHETEALRYRLQYKNLGDELNKLSLYPIQTKTIIKFPTMFTQIIVGPKGFTIENESQQNIKKRIEILEKRKRLLTKKK